MGAYNTILVPTDFSSYSDYATVYARALARDNNTAIHFVHVVDQRNKELAGRIGGAYVSSADLEALYVEIEKHAGERMAKLIERAAAAGLKAEQHLCTGWPSEEIVRVAEEIGADLIVIATHGHSGLNRLVLGSTCEKLIRCSPIPVLSVKHPEHEFADDASISLKKILCPCDFSDFSHLAIPYAAELCREFGASLKLAHVVAAWLDYPEFVPSVKQNNSPHLVEEAEKSLEKLASEQEGIEVHVEVDSGIPHRKLSDIIEKDNIDLVVMTTHGRSGIPHFLLGSVTEKILRTANCPVMTVRPKT